MARSTPYSRTIDRTADGGGELLLAQVTSRSDFLSLEGEWDALFDVCRETATMFQSHQWVRCCYDLFGETHKLCVLTAREEGRLVAVAPLIVDRRIGLPVLRWAGGHLAIYGDVLAAPSVDVGAWLSAAFEDVRSASCLFLENVRSDALVAPFLREGGDEISRQAAPMLDMAKAGSFAAWHQSLPKGTKRSRGRRLRNLEAKGSISFAFEKGGPGARQRVQQLFELKRAWAKSRTVLSRTIEDATFEALVTGLVTGTSGVESRLSTLMLDGTPIAIELGFVTGDRYLSYLGAYDPEFHTFSPGSLQLERTLEACFAAGYSSFDLLPPNDAYKAEWANVSVPVSTHALALSSIGVVQRELARLDLVGLAKAGLKHVPQPMRRALHTLAQKRADGLLSAKPYVGRLMPRGKPEWSLLALALAATAIIAVD